MTTNAPASTSTAPSERTSTSHRPRALAVVGAGLAALGVWVVAGPLAGVQLRVESASGVREVGPVAVVLSALVAGAAGWALLALLERTTRHARRTWTVIAVAVLMVSLVGPLGGVGAGSVLALAAMHLLVGAVLISRLPRR